jgi:hypothetical protein
MIAGLPPLGCQIENRFYFFQPYTKRLRSPNKEQQLNGIIAIKPISICSTGRWLKDSVSLIITDG